MIIHSKMLNYSLKSHLTKSWNAAFNMECFIVTNWFYYYRGGLILDFGSIIDPKRRFRFMGVYGI